MNYHIYSFCSLCAEKDWHVNTENLVSPHLGGKEIVEYFAEKYEEKEHADAYVILPCVGACINPDWFWQFIERSHPLTKAIRPQHYEKE